MNITTTFRQMDGSEAVKNYAHEKIGKLQKFLRQAMRADVTLSLDGKEHVAEVHIKSGTTSLHGSEASDDMYASIDLVVAKLERQIRSVNGNRDRSSRRGMRAAEFAESVAGDREW
jgi:putative sigma-54 modulation protein